jgi:hypothetical protein
MQISDIRDDDAELAQIVARLPKPTYPLQEVIRGGPAKTTKVFAEMGAGRLVSHFCGSRRFVFAIDYAKWLLLLKRESEARPMRNGKPNGEQAAA